MFNYGMKVSVYSEQKAEKDTTGWHRDGQDISYFPNNIRKDCYGSRYYYTLTFTYTFDYDKDSVFFAYCFPYSYTDLQKDILAIERDPKRQKFMQTTALCKTLAGINCELLTITDYSEKKESEKEPKIRHTPRVKPGVVISARVHPGETVGSWMMRGVLFFLTDPESEEARLLRENFVFKIIPMLNPDGVINGNYRCSLAGCDLNRRWKFPSK
jgi:cytosolic carboxypeptidase protein 2/3